MRIYIFTMQDIYLTIFDYIVDINSRISNLEQVKYILHFENVRSHSHLFHACRNENGSVCNQNNLL